MEKVIVAPSVLSLDYSDTKKQLLELENSNAEWMHFDVMDGQFVPNLSFGPQVLKGFKKNTTLFKDVHLMVENVEQAIELFAEDSDLITFHVEVNTDSKALIKKIKDKGIKVGISIKPNTPVEMIMPYLNEVDLVLVMSVEPGFGGQSFKEESLAKIESLKAIREENNYQYLIEVDGGINAETADLAIKAGVDVLVAGSYIFKGDIKEKVDSLWKEKQS